MFEYSFAFSRFVCSFPRGWARGDIKWWKFDREKNSSLTNRLNPSHFLISLLHVSSINVPIEPLLFTSLKRRVMNSRSPRNYYTPPSRAKFTISRSNCLLGHSIIHRAKTISIPSIFQKPFVQTRNYSMNYKKHRVYKFFRIFNCNKLEIFVIEFIKI